MLQDQFLFLPLSQMNFTMVFHVPTKVILTCHFYLSVHFPFESREVSKHLLTLQNYPRKEEKKLKKGMLLPRQGGIALD